jgi:predicted peptidase
LPRIPFQFFDCSENLRGAGKARALIEAFKKQSDGLEQKYEAHTQKGDDLVMPYRLFRPETSEGAPLVAYQCGSGGRGDDNMKQLGLGKLFGTRVAAFGEPEAFSLLHPRTANR